MTQSKHASYKAIIKEHRGILRVSTALRLGIPKHVLYEMVRAGDLVKEARGLYRLAETGPLGNPDLVQISLLMPKSVVFLISALYIHGLTTQIPHQVHIALPQGIKQRKIDYPPLKVFHLSKKPFEAGVEEHLLDRVPVKIYGREKTITDCFKYRNQIGNDIALEALKDYMRGASPNINLLMRYARINRVEKLIQPYIETLL